MLNELESFIPALRRYASALLRNQQDADDLVHDCLVRALDRLHTRRDDADLRPWLFAIMHNLFVTQKRRANTRPDRATLDEDEAASSSVPGGQENALRWTELLQCLNCLPEEQRTVILLVSVEELSYAEVAQVVGVPIGTVMSRLARGRERLRQIIEEKAHPVLRRVK